MADLQSMAAETTSRLSTLLDEAEQTQANVENAKVQITDIRAQIDEAWSGLSDQAQTVLGQVNTGKSELVTEADAVTQLLEQLKQKIDTVQQEILRELEETQGAIAAIDDRLNELNPALDEDLSAAEEALGNLNEKEIGVELEAATTEAVQELSEMMGELTAFQAELEQQTAGFQGFVSEQCVPAVTEGVTMLSDHLDGLGEHFTDQIQAVGDAMEQETQGLMEQVNNAQDELFQELESTAQQLEELMTKLESAVETASSSVVDASGAVVDGIDMTSTACRTAIDLLSRARESLEAI